MVSRAVIDDFLAQRRLAFVGVSHDAGEFSAEVYRELKRHGYELLPVNPHAEAIDCDPCVASVVDLPDDVDGAILMVPADRSADVVDECAAKGIGRIWLHRGAGPGSVSDEAVARCRAHDIAVVDGACPMMFMDDAGWFHRLHRWGRQKAGGLTA